MNARSPVLEGSIPQRTIFQDLVTEFGKTRSSNTTLVKLRSLSDVYTRCILNIIKLKKYEDATTDQAWKKAMDAEIEMIEKKNMGIGW